MNGKLTSWFKRHGLSWGASLALHAAILGPLCLITWVVTSAGHRDHVLTLGPVGAEGDAGADGDSDRPGGDGSAGAAGSGSDRLAPGPTSDARAVMPQAPAPAALTDLNTIAAQGTGADVGVSSNLQATNQLIHNLSNLPSGAPGAGGAGGRGFSLAGTGAGFGEAVGQLRGKGLEVVLVLDATDSMSPYIGQAKQRLKDILDVLDGLVPGAGVGVVAYKDYGDDYGPTAIKSLKITKDHKAIRDFINDITAGGGGDEPEPIHEALKVATNARSIGWSPGKRWVIILVGDSSIHSSGRQQAMSLSKAFANAHGTINAIDVGGSGEQGQRRDQVQPDLRNIAKEGGGSSFLLRDEQAFWQYLIVSVFGERFKNDVDVIIKRYVRDDKSTTQPERK